MFRILITAYMTAAMLAGPSVCCCSPMRAIAGCSTVEVVGATDQKAPCCGHDMLHREESGEPSEQDPCPCHKTKVHALGEAREQIVDLVPVRSLVPIPLAFALPVVTTEQKLGLGDRSQIINRGSHFGSAVELLCALRIYLI